MSARPGRAFGGALTALLLALSMVFAQPAHGSSARAAGATPAPPAATPAAQAVLTVHVDTLDPIIATPGKDVVARVQVRNTGAAATTGPVRVTARLGAASALLTRSQVREFATSGTPVGRVVAQATTTTAIAPSSQTTLPVTIPGASIAGHRPFGVLPLQFEAQAAPGKDGQAANTLPGGAAGPAGPAQADAAPREHGALTAPTALRATFLPYQSRKEYQPLEVSVLLPLTLDPNPALLTAAGAQRADAWAEALGPGSRIGQILSATARYPVTYVVDPAALDTPGHDGIAQETTPPAGGATGPATDTSPTAPNGSPTASPTARPTASPTTADPTATAADPPAAAPSTAPASTTTPEPTPEPTPQPTPQPTDPAEAIQQQLRERLRALAPTHPVWALPRNDPDLRALVAGGASASYLAQLLGPQAGAADTAALLGLPGVARIAWPVGPGLSKAALDRVRAAYGADGPTAVLAPNSAFDADPDVSATAVRRQGNTPVITYDDELSRLLTSANDPNQGAELTLQTLAETVTLLAESPGRVRHVAIAAGRDFSPDAGVLERLLSALQGAPWVNLGGTGPLLDPATAHVDAPERRAEAGDPLSPGPSPLTAAAVTRLQTERADIAGITGVLAATPTSDPVPDPETLDALASSRWRFAPDVWQQLSTELSDRVDTLTTGVSVVPSTINFFADHGVLQVTVVNELDVEVRGVHVVLEPQGRPPRLRIVSEPEPLTIRPGSRTTVRVQVEAVAAGIVPVSAHLATPADTRLGTDATVRVRVQPTNGWLLLALGGLTGIVFVAGLYRALRMGPRVSSESLKDIE